MTNDIEERIWVHNAGGSSPDVLLRLIRLWGALDDSTVVQAALDEENT